MILYGLPTCSECKKAEKALTAAGHTVTFRDVRADRLSDEEWAPLLHEFGDNIIDRKSQAFRNLGTFIKVAEADAQLREVPAVMARPIISDGTRFTLGWDDDIQAGWGA